jgi:CHAT domain-containing protein
VHVAAHGRLRSDNPLLSALDLADGPLTVYDLERLPAVPSLVVLPACQSGATAVRAGEEVMGLAHAMLALGSRAVVAALVPVPDAETGAVMTALHRELAAGSTPAEALARVQDESWRLAPRTTGAAHAFACFGAG